MIKLPFYLQSLFYKQAINLEVCILIVALVVWPLTATATAPRFSPQMFIDATTTVDVVTYQNPPHIRLENKDQSKVINFLEQLLQEGDVDASIRIEAVKRLALYSLLDNKTAAILADEQHLTDREKNAWQQTPLYHVERHFFYLKKNSPKIDADIKNIASLRGLVCGVPDNDNSTYLKNAGLRIKKGNMRQLLDKLMNGKIDLIVAERQYGLWWLKHAYKTQGDQIMLSKHPINSSWVSLWVDLHASQTTSFINRMHKGIQRLVVNGRYIKLLKSIGDKFPSQTLNKLKKRWSK